MNIYTHVYVHIDIYMYEYMTCIWRVVGAIPEAATPPVPYLLAEVAASAVLMPPVFFGYVPCFCF